jgi:hypothetical protein
MKNSLVGIMAVVVMASFLLAMRQNKAVGKPTENQPVKVEHLTGKEPTRVTLTEEAAKRLDIQTAKVRDTAVEGASRKTIPYAAILYDTQGNTWTYASSQPLIFVRTPITIVSIAGDQAILSAGPPEGSAVVTVGAAELYGSETEFEEE